MKKIAIFIITTYQKLLSPDSGILKKVGLIKKPVCVFFPTCSQYTIEAVNKYGTAKGVMLGVKRILRCHPWQKNRFDPLK